MTLRSIVEASAAVLMLPRRQDNVSPRLGAHHPAPTASAPKVGLSSAARDTHPDLDLAFYRAYYPDLRHLSDTQLLSHYSDHGKSEGRLCSMEERRARQWSELSEVLRRVGEIPTDFDWKDYLAIHSDLGLIKCEVEARLHYARFGRPEGRRAFLFDDDLYRELYFEGSTYSREWLLEHYRSEGRDRGFACKGRDLLAAAGLPEASWLDRVPLDEFRQMNESWAGPIATRRDVLTAMQDKGFSILAPLSFTLVFVPAYYREVRPDLATYTDAALYRHWLFEGFDAGDPGSPRDHLRALDLSMSSYPVCFDWKAYRTAHSRDHGNRWETLEHLLKAGIPSGHFVPIKGKEGGDFLLELARYADRHNPDRSIARYRAVASTRNAPPETAFYLARAHVRAGQWKEASTTFTDVLRHGTITIEVCAEAVATALQLDNINLAFDALRRSRSTCGGDVRFREALRNTIDAAFRKSWAAAENLYRSGWKDEADEIMAKVVRQIAEAWTTLDPLGAILPKPDPQRIVMFANVDLPQCTFYRVEQKVDILEAAGFKIEVYAQHEVEAFLTALPGAGTAIFYRLPAMPMNIRAIQVARTMGIATIYDIDDLIFDPAQYPEPIQTYGTDVSLDFYTMLQLGVPLFRGAMALCEFGIASTTALAEHMKDIVTSGDVFVLPNGLDHRTEPYLRQLTQRVRDDAKGPVLFYGSGTKAHNSDFVDLVGDALVSVFEKYPDARLIVVGYLSLSKELEAYRSRITAFDWVADVREYWSLLAEADIAIAVLAPYATTDAKSEIKWLEATLFGVPSIVSATHRYAEVIDDGNDAMLARTSADWAAAIDHLAANKNERTRLVTNARTKIAEQYSIAANAARAKAIIAAVASKPAPHRKKRVLLVNIFFPPQTIGGSTRVTRDNLDFFLDTPAVSKDFEFAVLACDNDAPHTYRMRVENYRDRPVYRIAPGDGPNLEWKPYDAKIGALFRGVLASFEPDLVHFHCVQRLSGSIISECIEAGVPYVTTAHDAWWLSDYHFLVDQRGVLRQPNEDMPSYPPPPATISQSLERRRLLRSLLEGSEEILSVSDAFTSIYHRGGYTRTRTVANGVPPLTPTKRVPSPNGKVRLAHIGSMTHHKGYHLVQAAFQQSSFENLELTVVDHARFGGQRDVTQWGRTDVAFVGKTKQEDMHAFYASIDILLAPSIWPESFGLVTREALAAGCWVIASDRGAVGDSIASGVNGWVIDVANAKPLAETLAGIDAQPEKYLGSPPRQTTAPRTAADQGADLVEIYRDVLARPKKPVVAPIVSGVARVEPPYLAYAMPLGTTFASRTV